MVTFRYNSADYRATRYTKDCYLVTRLGANAEGWSSLIACDDIEAIEAVSMPISEVKKRYAVNGNKAASIVLEMKRRIAKLFAK